MKIKKIKKIIKQYTISIVAILTVFIIIREMNDNRPFKFEDYDYDNIDSVVQKRFPLGSNVDEVIEILVASGVHEIFITKVENYIAEGTKRNAEYIISFEYYSPVISLNPDALYTIYTQIDKNRKIIEIGGSMLPFLSGLRW